MLADFIMTSAKAKVVSHKMPGIENIPPEEIIHSHAYLDNMPFSTLKKDEKKLLTVSVNSRVLPSRDNVRPLKINQDDPDADIIVLDDAGNGFRYAENVWPSALKRNRKSIVILENEPSCC